MTPEAVPAGGITAETTALIEVLHQTDRRLMDLTAGEVDTVADSHGRTFMLLAAQEALREGDASRQAALLNALPAYIALLDAEGVIVSVNEAWRGFVDAGAIQDPGHEIGCNYPALCDADRGERAEASHRVAAGVRSILAGAKSTVSIHYSSHSPAAQRWFVLTVTPLSGSRPNGAVVLHLDVTGEIQAQKSLRISESRFRQMADNISDVFFLTNLDRSQVYYVSPAYERICGRSCESLYANPASWADSTHPDDRERVLAEFSAGRDAGFDCEYRLSRPDGGVRWIHVRGFPILNEAGLAYRTAGVATDITARKEAEDKLRRLNRVQAVLSGITSVVVRVRDREELFREACRIAVDAGAFKTAWIGAIDPQTLEGKVLTWSGVVQPYVDKIRLTGRDDVPESELPACRALRLLQPVICNDVATDPDVAEVRDKLLRRGLRSMGFFPLPLAGRPSAVIALFAGETNFFDGEETLLLLEMAGNLSFALDHLEKAEQLNYVAYYDLLTGLANRRLFLERVTQYLRSAASGEHKLALCVLDLERFKNINDTFGQPAGDALLQQMADWLKRNLGEANLLARVGADQFAVVLPEVLHEEVVARLLEKAMKVFLEHPFKLNGSVFRVAAKAGVALFPDDGNDADTLFRHAESALKKAKVSRDRYLFYAQKMTETVAGRLVLDYQLRHALDNDQFVLHYQPKVNLASGRLTGAEALLRWNDPQTGLVPPGRFIPILEETGLIFEAGRWALRKAVETHLRWRAAGFPCVRIAVNVSPVQLRNRGFIDDIAAVIGGDANAARGLEIEITESLVMEDVKRTIGTLRAIRAMGVTIAIDDFGTGFSSLSYLARLPADTLKIDRSFVTAMNAGPEGMTLISAIINLAHSLKLQVVAEGVETNEQARLLRTLKCDAMQGFLLSRPVPDAVFETRFLGSCDEFIAPCVVRHQGH